jgi:polysaccharide pyruvyl transferase WcaK-like protein
MLQSLSSWNPFDYLIERDSSEKTNPEISFLSTKPKVPVVGIILVHPQKEYGIRGKHDKVNQVIQQFIQSNEFSVVHIDTRLDVNKTNLRSPGEVESIIAKMDVIITTRLHGMVLALKNNVPAIAIDPISGGAKIMKQAKTVEWPIIIKAEEASEQELQKAFKYCLTPEAKQMANKCNQNARTKILTIKENFTSIFENPKSK